MPSLGSFSLREPEDVALLYDLASSRLALSPDGSRLVRVRSGTPIERSGNPYRYTVIDGYRCSLYEVAYVLRHGRGAPLPYSKGPKGQKLGKYLPIDGDWSHVHPSNWRQALPRGWAGREAARRARVAAELAGLPHGGRFAAEFDRLADPRGWWVMCTARWGEMQEELSTPWGVLRARAPRWWALVTHVARSCREAILSDPTTDPADVRKAGDALLMRVILSPTEWARVTAAELRRDPAPPPDDVSAHEANQDAADVAQPAPEGLY